jgi:hypothetical protein
MHKNTKKTLMSYYCIKLYEQNEKQKKRRNEFSSYKLGNKHGMNQIKDSYEKIKIYKKITWRELKNRRM